MGPATAFRGRAAQRPQADLRGGPQDQTRPQALKASGACISHGEARPSEVRSSKRGFLHFSVVNNEDDASVPTNDMHEPALRNPHLLQILPLTSLLHKGENLVYARDAHDVSRKEIYKILTHAGLIPRKRFPPSDVSHDNNHIPVTWPEEWNEQQIYGASYLHNQDLLQYL
ncbi:hypothetical protein PYW07_004542 [Mythimna separata]|uniref:Uncharacterized protein n=1 Tax=Mythimna separata TaxID=271217 RepID=A0AAD7YZC2_MYTSE|nr:hypothetical protein PYW07_004542 [Mythimna separata]